MRDTAQAVSFSFQPCIRRGIATRSAPSHAAISSSSARSAAAITTIGNLLLEDGALDEAIAHYEYALLIDAEYAPAYHNLGVALHRSGRRVESVRMLRKATRLEGRKKHR